MCAILSGERLVALALGIQSAVAVACTVFERITRKLAALAKATNVAHVAVLPDKSLVALARSITKAAAISATLGGGIAHGFNAAGLAVLSSGTQGTVWAGVAVETLARSIVHATAIV